MKRAAGVLLLLVLALLALQKARSGVLPEMLWACHVATALLALGLLADRPRWSAAGFLFHLAVAAPAYLLLLATGGETSRLSALSHLLSPLIGAWAWRGRRLPPGTAWLAFAACYAAPLLVCRGWTSPELNINLAFQPWQPLAFIGRWPSRVLAVAEVAALLVGVQWLLGRRRALQRDGVTPAEPTFRPG